jgi:hypothetical protein
VHQTSAAQARGPSACTGYASLGAVATNNYQKVILLQVSVQAQLVFHHLDKTSAVPCLLQHQREHNTSDKKGRHTPAVRRASHCAVRHPKLACSASSMATLNECCQPSKTLRAPSIFLPVPHCSNGLVLCESQFNWRAKCAVFNTYPQPPSGVQRPARPQSPSDSPPPKCHAAAPQNPHSQTHGEACTQAPAHCTNPAIVPQQMPALHGQSLPAAHRKVERSQEHNNQTTRFLTWAQTRASLIIAASWSALGNETE